MQLVAPVLPDRSARSAPAEPRGGSVVGNNVSPGSKWEYTRGVVDVKAHARGGGALLWTGFTPSAMDLARERVREGARR
jgi:hypothetical protein